MLAVRENRLVIAERLIELGALINDQARVSQNIENERKQSDDGIFSSLIIMHSGVNV